MVVISSVRFAVTPCATLCFSFEKEFRSEKSRLLDVSGSVCSTRRQEIHVRQSLIGKCRPFHTTHLFPKSNLRIGQSPDDG